MLAQTARSSWPWRVWLKEGSEVIEEDFKDAVLDAELIGAAQRVEHNEIAAYGTVREFAKFLGETEDASFLEKNLLRNARSI